MEIEAKIIENQADTPQLERFFSIPESEPDPLSQARKQLEGVIYPRQKLAEALKCYNQEIDNDQLSLDAIDTLKLDDTFAVVTGQQLGFMGGPAYTILKAITCLKLAKQANAIPIFWLATEDHDVREVDHSYLQDDKGNLKEYRLDLPKDGQSVESMPLSPYDHEMIALFLKDTRQEVLLDFFANQSSYAKAMASFLAKLFKGTGLVFLEPKILRPLAKEFFTRELKETEAIQNILSSTAQDLQKAGGHPVLKADGTNVFFARKHQARQKIVWKEGRYILGKEPVALSTLMDLIEQTPESFSPNVAGRPVMQSLLIPTLAYVAGPGEMNYHRQLKGLFKFHDVPMPWILPRLEATFITAKAKRFLDALGLKPWEIASLGQSSVAKQKLLKEDLQARGIPTSALHELRNLITPHQKPQSRVLNWCGFQKETKENLIDALLRSSKAFIGHQHYYCYLNDE